MMNLAVSEIAWLPDQEHEASFRLNELGVTRIELAPARSFGNPLEANEGEVRRRVEELNQLGMEPRSFQALLFGQEGLFLFEGTEARQRMMKVLKACGQVAGWAGVGPMVFGSPKNRLRGGMSLNEADRIAVGFFRELGDFCAEQGSMIVMESNPEAYGADYCTRLDQAAELVEKVDSPGFRLHVDAGGLALSGEDFAPVLRQSIGLVAHVHASQPMLASFEQPDSFHAELGKLLRELNYSGDVAIEMRKQEDGLESVEAAITAVSKLYGGSLGF